MGRPSDKPIVWFKGFLYQVASWKTARRVVAKVEFHAEELFPRVMSETAFNAVVSGRNAQETQVNKLDLTL